MNIQISYDGQYPNLCRGHLRITIDGVLWDFGDGALTSTGGTNWRAEDDEESVWEGPWLVDEWPKNFPEKYKHKVLDAINNTISWGCCGGCL